MKRYEKWHTAVERLIFVFSIWCLSGYFPSFTSIINDNVAMCLDSLEK